MDEPVMTEVEQNELILFALGDAPAQLARRLRARAERDPDLALQLDVLRAYRRSTAPPPSRVRRWLITRTSLVAVLLMLTLVISVGVYKAVSPQPLLQDSFNGSALDLSKWEKARDVALVDHGHLRLVNRGSIRTAYEFVEPISISLRWQWKDLTGGDETYADTLTVALRSQGFHSDEHHHEVLDAVRVTVRGHSAHGQVSLSWPGLPKPDLIGVPFEDFPVRPDVWYDIRITDDGQIIRVYFAGPGIDPKYIKEPLIQGQPQGTWLGRRILIYNREHLADVPHESHVTDVVIDELRH